MKYLLTAAFVFFSEVILAQYKAEIFHLDSKKRIFQMQLKSTDANQITTQDMEIKDLDQKKVYTEKSELKGAEFLKSELQSFQLETQAKVEVKKKDDGLSEVHFWKKDLAKNKEQTVVENVKGDIVIQANFVKYITSKWPQLMKNETIEFRFISWERMETVGFKIYLDKMQDLHGKKTALIIMKPTSAIIRLLVNPLKLSFTEDGSQLLEMTGRVTPKLKSGNSWKDLEAFVTYSYE